MFSRPPWRLEAQKKRHATAPISLATSFSYAAARPASSNPSQLIRQMVRIPNFFHGKDMRLNDGEFGVLHIRAAHERHCGSE
jgi:hypothetical protein